MSASPNTPSALQDTATSAPDETFVSLVHNVGYILRLVWQAAPRWNILNLILVVLQGLLPLLALFFMKQIIDAVMRGVLGPDEHQSIHQVLLWVALAGGVALLLAASRALAVLATEAQSLLVQEKFSSLIQEQSATVDLDFYENAQAHNLMSRAQQDAQFRPQAIFSTLISLLQNTLSVLGIFGLLLAYNWKLTLLITLLALPAAVIGFAYGRKMHALLKQQAEEERRARYYHLVQTDPYPAKEIRLFGLGPYFSARYRSLQASLRAARLHIFRGRAVSDLLAQGVATLAIFTALGVIGLSALQRIITVGTMVMYYQAFQSGAANLQSLLRALTNLYEHSLFVAHIAHFLQLKPQITAVTPTRPVPAPALEGVRFHDVSFTYPGAAHPTLRDIDLTLAPGQVIALVGENGAGKTTLIKLLCRLYDPTTGHITLDDTDIRHFTPEEWRQHLSVVFQDFMRYYATVEENICVGDVRPGGRRSAEPQLDVIAAMRDAAHAAGIADKIESLPQGYQTMLGKTFTGGEELSGGEWQKIALARAFMRDAPIIVLDEPSSSLDPLAEVELFTHFRTLLAGKSAILISHRFSTVQMADDIYLLERGRIIERGTHQQLLFRDGAYAHLFRTQAESYQTLDLTAKNA